MGGWGEQGFCQLFLSLSKNLAPGPSLLGTIGHLHRSTWNGEVGGLAPGPGCSRRWVGSFRPPACRLSSQAACSQASEGGRGAATLAFSKKRKEGGQEHQSTKTPSERGALRMGLGRGGVALARSGLCAEGASREPPKEGEGGSFAHAENKQRTPQEGPSPSRGAKVGPGRRTSA